MRTILNYLAETSRANETIIAECMFSYALISLKIGNDMVGLEDMQKSHQLYSNI